MQEPKHEHRMLGHEEGILGLEVEWSERTLNEGMLELRTTGRIGSWPSWSKDLNCAIV